MEEHVLGIGIQNATASNVHVIDQIGFCTGWMVVLAAHLLFQWISEEFIELLILRARRSHGDPTHNIVLFGILGLLEPSTSRFCSLHPTIWAPNALLWYQSTPQPKYEKRQSVYFVATHDKGKSKRDKSAPHLKKDNKLSIKKNDNKDTCFFCKKGGHMKKDCQKYKRWLEKKGFSQHKETGKQ
ncbi:uncharacterized protein LOC133871909 [Alnus glutinosa]|uniref:uncharacterized protein LOC133871909 n=1 Tax=Alnus glutinosa TaxID=3517 RepID=UPI002D78BD74|nr:uncharacterized protein LOC133871909 [Alnus glutinosa]